MYPDWYLELQEHAKNKEPPFKDGVCRIIPNEVIGRDSELLTHFQEYIGRTVKHDEHTKNIVFFTGLSAYCPDYTNKLTPLNTFLKGESSTGKTYNVTETIKIFPPEDVWLLGGMSPKALVHGHGVLVDAEEKEIDLDDKPTTKKPREPKQRRGETQENYAIRVHNYEEALAQWKDDRRIWKERMQHSKYVVNLHGKILVFLEPPQIETFMMLRPILSHDAKEISFRFVDKSGSGSLQTRNVVLRGWCATIFCTTNIDYLEELSTRSFTASPSATSEKYRAGINLTGDRSAFPMKYREDEEYELLKNYLSFLSERQKTDLITKQEYTPFKVMNPFAREFTAVYPSHEARSMRDIQHILALMNVSATFYHLQRPSIRIEEDLTDEGHDRESEIEHYILVTFHDLVNVFQFLPQIAETTLMGMPQSVIDTFRKCIIPLYKENPEGITYEQLVEKHNEVMNVKMAYTSIRNHVKALSDVGYVTTILDREDRRKKRIKPIKEIENPLLNVLQQFLKIFDETAFKSWFDSLKNYVFKKRIFLKTLFCNKNNHEVTSSNDKELSEIYKKHFKSDTVLKTQFEDIKSGLESEKRGLETFFLSKDEKRQFSSEKTIKTGNLTKRFGIEYANWIEFNERERGVCWTCGKASILSARVTAVDNKRHNICQECGEQIMDELRQEIGDL